MNQGYRQAPQRRRRLTPEQRQRIMKQRRRQRMKKRLMIIVPAIVVLIVVLVLILGGRGSRDAVAPEAVDAMSAVVDDIQPSPSAEAPADAQDGGMAAMPDDALDGGQDGQASSDDAQLSLFDDALAAPDSSESPQASAAPAETTAVASVPFDYDEAYARAMTGEITGPDIVVDHSNVDPSKLDRWPEDKEGYIPILWKAKTDENIIAITVDDCFQAENFRTIVQCALDNGGKLTIFPIGENLEKAGVAETLRYAYQNGMEIGNHTYTHSGLFHFDQERMSNEIWAQTQKVNEVLGVNYDQHFFRPRGGDERECQRLHGYLNQLGYDGIAMWSLAGSASSMDGLYKDLAPGRIYLFHTTNYDLELLLQFIPGAVARGYRLVTMSEMFGLGENAVSEYKPQTAAPEPTSFRIVPKKLKENDYNRATVVLQNRLIELGWMEGNADGVYGKQTVLAIGFLQMALEQKPDGVASAELQSIIFSDDAPRGSLEQVQAFCRKLGKTELKSLPGSKD